MQRQSASTCSAASLSFGVLQRDVVCSVCARACGVGYITRRYNARVIYAAWRRTALNGSSDVRRTVHTRPGSHLRRNPRFITRWSEGQRAYIPPPPSRPPASPPSSSSSSFYLSPSPSFCPPAVLSSHRLLFIATTIVAQHRVPNARFHSTPPCVHCRRD